MKIIKSAPIVFTVQIDSDELNTIRWALKETSKLLHNSWKIENNNENDIVGEKEQICLDILNDIKSQLNSVYGKHSAKD